MGPASKISPNPDVSRVRACLPYVERVSHQGEREVGLVWEMTRVRAALLSVRGGWERSDLV